jgi:hypothetical protein
MSDLLKYFFEVVMHQMTDSIIQFNIFIKFLHFNYYLNKFLLFLIFTFRVIFFEFGDLCNEFDER